MIKKSKKTVRERMNEGLILIFFLFGMMAFASGDLYGYVATTGDNMTGNLNNTGNYTGDYFIGDGSLLTNINCSECEGDFVRLIGDTMTGGLVIDGPDNQLNFSIDGVIRSDTGYAPLLELGLLSSATGYYSVAVGLNAEADSTDAIAMGSGASASAAQAVTIGSNSGTSGTRAATMGYFSAAAGSESLCLGSYNYASSAYSSAIGFQSSTYGIGSTSIGGYAKSYGTYAVSIGRSTNASGEYSTAIGKNVTAVGYNSFSFGEDGINEEDSALYLSNLAFRTTSNATIEDHLNASSFLLTASVEADLSVSSLSTKLAGVNDPDFDKFLNDGSGSRGSGIYYFDSNSEEEVYVSFQLPYSWDEGTDITPKLHWAPSSTDTNKTAWGFEYTWADEDETFGNTVILRSAMNATGASYDHLVLEFPDIDGSGHTGASIVSCRVFRDAENVTDDQYVSDAGLLSISLGYFKNKLGGDTD